MRRVDEPWLVNMALGVLEEVAARADLGVEPRTRSIRLCLAFLWWVAPKKDRWPFDNFWRSMAMTNAIARHANVSASLNAIYLALGRNRGLEAAAQVEAKRTGQAR
jgi:hypothetical protein